MKFYIDIEKKMHRHYYNLAQGIKFTKNKKQIKTYSEICIKNYLVILAFLFLGCFLDTFVKLENISFVVIILTILAFLVNTILLLIFIYKYLKQKDVHAEVKILEDGIIEYQENGKEIKKSWKEVEKIVLVEEAIFVIFNKNTFILPSVPNLEKTLLKESEKQNITVINAKDRDRGIKRTIKVLTPSFLVLIFTFSFYLIFLYYNLNTLYSKINRIIDSQNVEDTKVYSYGKYGIVEEELTAFFQEFYKNQKNYNENSAIGIFSTFTPTFLEQNRNNLASILKNELPNKRIKAEAFLKNMISLLQQEKVNSRILKWNLDSYYTDIYYEYFESASSHIQILQQELSINDAKMDYLERIILLLNRKDACWKITDNNLVFCNSIDAEEYNHLYDLILNENTEISNGGITA